MKSGLYLIFATSPVSGCKFAITFGFKMAMGKPPVNPTGFLDGQAKDTQFGRVLYARFLMIQLSFLYTVTYDNFLQNVDSCRPKKLSKNCQKTSKIVAVSNIEYSLYYSRCHSLTKFKTLKLSS